MPKSKVRKKTPQSPSGDRRTPVAVEADQPTSTPYKAVMFGSMLLGLFWLVVNYLAGQELPVMSDLGNWNFAIGFVFLIVGLLMTMRWR